MTQRPPRSHTVHTQAHPRPRTEAHCQAHRAIQGPLPTQHTHPGIQAPHPPPPSTRRGNALGPARLRTRDRASHSRSLGGRPGRTWAPILKPAEGGKLEPSAARPALLPGGRRARVILCSVSHALPSLSATARSVPRGGAGPARVPEPPLGVRMVSPESADLGCCGGGFLNLAGWACGGERVGLGSGA
jgi:hypothetical protein